jgi:glucose 1-dehydrogenase
MKRFDGRVALITGAGQGIGRAIAVRLAQEGANIVVNDLRESDNSKETMRQLAETGCKAIFIATDVSNVTAVRAMFENAVEQMGGLDILVNNAGIEIRAPFWEATEQQYDAVMNVNLKGMFFCTQAFTQHIMSAKKTSAVVVNNSSVHEELPMPNFTAYCASKGGMQMVMRNLSVELAPLGIRINNVAPGAIKTPINEHLLSKPELVQALKQNISMQRLGEPEDVAALVAFLASDDAKYVTGSTYYVDGGLTWHYTEQ